MQNALPGRGPPKKASGFVVRRRLCRRWAENYPYPSFHPRFPRTGLTYRRIRSRCQEPRPIPPGCRGQVFEPLGRLQLQILGAGYWL